MGPLSVISKTETEITLVWSELSGPATGNSLITAYTLYWDDNSGSVDSMLISDLVTTYHVQGTTGGLTYKFSVTASNIYGEGESSDVLEQLASDVPNQLAIVQTSIVDTDFVISWSAPFDNYEAILEYDIIILSASGAYIHSEDECDGQDPSVTECKIDMHKVISLTGLTRG